MTKVIAKVDGLEFICEHSVEVWRAETLLEKEPGTIKWLQGLQEGDVFYDIGASTGIYSLYAARRVGATGHVYAFEPHVMSARSLMRNILHNKMQDRVTLLTCALNDHSGLIPFNYQNLAPGTGGSQLGHTNLEMGGEFTPQTTELKYAVPIDRLLYNETRQIRFANVVKIDVDGNELKILTGMRSLLYSSTLRSVQVEIHPQTWAGINDYLVKMNYVLDHTHYTKNGQDALSKGKTADEIAYNAVFVRS